MSRKGDGWDNAAPESFFHLLKAGLVYHGRWESYDEAYRSCLSISRSSITESGVIPRWVYNVPSRGAKYLLALLVSLRLYVDKTCYSDYQHLCAYYGEY